MRRAIAAAMSRSKREIPHYYVSSEIDLGPAMTWLAAKNERLAPADRLLPGVLFLKAVALALREHPELNAHWTPAGPEQKSNIHVGAAIALRGGGLVAPAIHDTDKLSLDALMAAFRDLVERTRSGSVRSSELSDGTITVTSLGERGADSVAPVIYPPQVAIVGFGRIVSRARVVDGAVAPRPTTICTLAGDHRVSDGMRGSTLLASIESLLARPEAL
jgi:pyruvate dehydrogenase E2 component (dihydrolipoamide acetyltransferase)